MRFVKSDSAILACFVRPEAQIVQELVVVVVVASSTTKSFGCLRCRTNRVDGRSPVKILLMLTLYYAVKVLSLGTI